MQNRTPLDLACQLLEELAGCPDELFCESPDHPLNKDAASVCASADSGCTVHGKHIEANCWKRLIKKLHRGEMSLTEALKLHGYTHKPLGHNYIHAVYKDGEEVFRGMAGAVWEWLKKRDKA